MAPLGGNVSYAAQHDALMGCKDVEVLNKAHPKPSKVRYVRWHWGF
jgi:hypothetical protein